MKEGVNGKIITYHLNGSLYTVKYYLKGKLHRIDGPADNSYYSNRQKCHEEYRINGYPHRVDGPAFTSWYPDGIWREMEYWQNNRPHRADGPAYIENHTFYKKYFYQGKRMDAASDEEFKKIVKLISFL